MSYLLGQFHSSFSWLWHGFEGVGTPPSNAQETLKGKNVQIWGWRVKFTPRFPKVQSQKLVWFLRDFFPNL